VTQRCTGVILAGGQATRYGGRAKGLERVGGQRVIDRVAEALASTTDDLLLIANDPSAAEWLPGVRMAADARPGCGSLGGIHAALVHARGPALVVAWDMPFVPAALLGALRALGESERADVAVPESDSRRGVEPLCAYYTPACIAPIERCLDADDRRVIGFYDAVRVARLRAEQVRQYGDPARLFMNVNTPDELLLAERHASTLSAADGGHHRPQASR
jgi:molybdopterin-guanine dinucleotide biosynthesis protein A